jgi:hypothetical protein
LSESENNQDFFDLVAFGLFAWVGAMAAPLLTLDGYFDA